MLIRLFLKIVNLIYGTILNNMGILYWVMGQYEKAEPFCLKGKAIREKVLGKEHPEYAASLNNLGAMYLDMGQNEKAEPLYLEAKTSPTPALFAILLATSFGRQNPHLAFAMICDFSRNRKTGAK